MNKLLLLIIATIFMAFSFVFAKNALHMFQQNRYEFKRYTKWLFSTKNIHFSPIVIYIVLMFILSLLKLRFTTNIILTIMITIGFAIYEIIVEDKKEYIKPLVLTGRVKRQIVAYSIISLIVQYFLVKNLINNLSIVGIVNVFLPYLLVYVVGLVTLPIENAIKKKYENEARTILDNYNDLIKIGVTGSYGKTTTKNVIKDIIGEKYYTLITPVSYNTPMGITRTIRENLKPIHEIFVCEMGADHVGEITYLMDFVKPKYGIVTTIGPQHLNTFGSLENIIKEKMQEIEKLPSDGVGIINIDNEYIRNYQIKNTCKVVTVGIENTNADYVAYDIKPTNEGTKFKVRLKGKTRGISFETILLGEHNVLNILCGIALAKELKIDNKEIVKGVKNIKQIEHRLQIKKINNYTFIDNAFNSNPVGCKRSLDVLKMMPGKRIIVTPGLIDLGKQENDANYEFGAYMKDRTDFVILVGDKNTAYIRKGLNSSGYSEEQILVVNTVKEAFAYIYKNFKTKDTILLENDLPDAFLY